MKNIEKKVRKVSLVGNIATIVSIGMYISYIPQILDNLSGVKGNPIQPLVAGINCVFWVIYAIQKEKTDWPVMVANLPGILLGILTFATSL